MKVVKKIGAVVLSMMMVLALCATAFATDDSNANSMDTDITVTKLLYVSNNSNYISKVAGPGITYNYSLATVEEDPLLTISGGTADGSAVGLAYAGNANVLTLNNETVSFPVSEMFNSSASGLSNNKYITLSIDEDAALSMFKATKGDSSTVSDNDSLVYVWELDESITDAEKEAVGVDDETSSARYLYVQFFYALGEGDTEGTTTYADATGSIDGWEAVLTDENGWKTDGFNGKTETSNTWDSTDNTLADTDLNDTDAFVSGSEAHFDTYNAKIVCSTTGSGDKYHSFPYSIDVNDGNRYVYVGTDDTSLTAANDRTFTTSLANGETYYVYALSRVGILNFTETNDTENTYKITITNNELGEVSESVEAGKSITSGTFVPYNDSLQTKVNNYLTGMSLTGVTLTYGAPLLVLAAAILLLFARRRSEENDK